MDILAPTTAGRQPAILARCLDGYPAREPRQWPRDPGLPRPTVAMSQRSEQDVRCHRLGSLVPKRTNTLVLGHWLVRAVVVPLLSANPVCASSPRLSTVGAMGSGSHTSQPRRRIVLRLSPGRQHLLRQPCPAPGGHSLMPPTPLLVDLVPSARRPDAPPEARRWPEGSERATRGPGQGRLAVHKVCPITS